MFRRGSIQRRLFISFSAVVLTLIVLFALLSYFYISRTLTQNATDYMRAQSESIRFQTDAVLQDANVLSGKLLFSQELLDLFYSDMFDYKSGTLQKQHQFNALIYAIIGPQFPPYQINWFRLTGEYAGVGDTALITRQPPDITANIPWLAESQQLDGAKLIVTTHSDNFGYQRQPVISLARTFAPRWGSKKDSIIEIQVMYSQIEELVERQLADAKGSQVFIFDPTGALVYPLGEAEQASAYYEAVRDAGASDMLTRKIGGENQVLAYTHSTFTHWTVAVAQSYDSLFEPVSRFRNSALLAACGVLLLMLLITYTISRSLTTPIKQMHRSVAELTLDTLPNDKAFKIDTNVNELQELNSAFRTMCVRLRESVHETVVARSAALQARLLALQAQMNQHFLYNMLATISILAEKGKSAQVIRICESLAEMMRYISSGIGQLVTIAEELRHAHLYAGLMRIRFADELDFSSAVATELMDIPIPKLTITPLVENCFKHATTGAPPWHISLVGKIEGESWLITVTDNGAGFSQDALDDLGQKLKAASETPQALELDGMGLVNIHLRLSLHYGAQAVFEYGNRSERGAFVTVGGPTVLAKGGNGVDANL